MPSSVFATEIATFADRLAAASANVTLPLFRTPLDADDKSDDGVFDPVTAADRDAETAMRALIRDAYPEHGIEGEEHDDERTDADYVWVLDPIDGTRAFISGLPLWGTLIGLKHKGKPVFGLLHQPFTGETFTGATFPGEEPVSLYRRGSIRHDLRTRARPELSEATISTTSPRQFSGATLEAYDRVERQCRLARYGYDCYAYAMLAAGHVDLVVEAGLKPCDILPLVPIIEAAGGIVTTWDGAPVTAGGTAIAAGDARLHEAALALLGA
ncbi:histidinol-phosphatase [Pseudochelatococcus contaminans]|uniref:Histidinol-phosphatase n=1 Tax=Pseudochelatococcus contaminans TaxID=1538103 RepID=A0A7W5Z3D7_9HYPH|nr:myo-inositol-1(or 4)-monophosphatase [Pseudochelatococcus contaminans]